MFKPHCAGSIPSPKKLFGACGRMEDETGGMASVVGPSSGAHAAASDHIGSGGDTTTTTIPTATTTSTTGAIVASPGPSRRAAGRRRPKIVKPPTLAGPDDMNWLIHQYYVKQDFARAEALADKQLAAHGGRCEHALYIKALIRRNTGEMEESLKLFQKAMHLHPLNKENAKQVARTLFLMARHHAAINVYDQILAAGVRDWHVLHNRGVCLSYVDRLDEAKTDMIAALELHKHDVSFIQLGKFHLMGGNVHDAIAVYLEALIYSPENSELFTTLGLLYLQIGDTPKAFDFFGRAMTYDARDPTAILGAGSVIQQCDDFDVALVKYRVLAATSPESPELWNNVGMCFFGKGKLVAAIACLKHAIYLNPFDWKVCFNLGLAHLKTQQYASAFHYLSASVNLEQSHAESYMLLGMALAYLDDNDNAKAAFAKAAELRPDDPMIALNFGIVEYAGGNATAAAEWLSRYETVAPKSKKDDGAAEMRDAAEQLGSAIQVGDGAVRKPIAAGSLGEAEVIDVCTNGVCEFLAAWLASGQLTPTWTGPSGGTVWSYIAAHNDANARDMSALLLGGGSRGKTDPRWASTMMQPDDTGRTALHIAAARGKVSFVAMLLENGGDRTVKTADGETPYDLALQNGHAECAMFLRLNSDDDGFAGETIRSTVI